MQSRDLAELLLIAVGKCFMPEVLFLCEGRAGSYSMSKLCTKDGEILPCLDVFEL